MTQENQRSFGSAEALTPKASAVIDSTIIEAAFDMLNEEGRPAFDAVERALNMFAHQYLDAKSRRKATPKAKDLRAKMEPFAEALQAVVEMIDELPEEAFRALNASGGSEAKTQLWEEAGDIHLPDLLCDLIAFSERFDTWFNMPEDPKGPRARPELKDFVTSLIELYTMYIEAPPTHSASKDSIYEGAPQSHAGRYVDLIVRAVDPEIPPSRVSGTLKKVLRSMRENGDI
ncbi:MAG: hypothetical protein AAFQ85_00605 [Pseudomonadota bacterium]